MLFNFGGPLVFVASFDGLEAMVDFVLGAGFDSGFLTATEGVLADGLVTLIGFEAGFDAGVEGFF